MKAKTILFTLVFVLSVNSEVNAYEFLPVALNDKELLDASNLLNDEVSTSNYGEYLDDIFNRWIALNLQTEPETYTVVEGDNLYRIALKHNIPLESLMSWNGLTGDLIHPDDVLIVSGDMEEGDSEKVEIASSPTHSTDGAKEMVVTATAYTAYCTGCSGTTAYGIDLRTNPNQKVIAVDPRIIPLGTKVWVEGYGEAIAGDTGGAIKGNKIDVFIPSYDSAMQWGVKKVKVRVFN